jgi:hypothetical protein
MALVAEPASEIIDAEIAAKIADPKFVNGRLVGGTIVDGRVIAVKRRQRPIQPENAEPAPRRPHLQGEIVGLIAFFLAILVVVVLRNYTVG